MFLRLCKKQKNRIEKQKDKIRYRKINDKQKNRMRNRTLIHIDLSSNAISSRFDDKNNN